MVYGYTRVSTEKQDAARQHSDLLESANKAGLLIESWVEEKISSRNGDRMIFPLVERLREDDMILVTELSRLGRSVREIQALISEVAARKATILVTTNSMRLGAKMDIAGETMLFALSISAQLERDIISERTKSGLRAARASGKTLGRPAGKSKLDDKAEEIERYLAKGINKSDIARLLDVSRSLLASWLKGRKGKGAKA